MYTAILYYNVGKMKSCSPTADLNNYVERESAVLSCVHGQRYDIHCNNIIVIIVVIHDHEFPHALTPLPLSIRMRGLLGTCMRPYLVNILYIQVPMVASSKQASVFTVVCLFILGSSLFMNSVNSPIHSCISHPVSV